MTDPLRTTIRRTLPARRVLAVGVVALVLVFAGCSGGGGGTTTAPDAGGVGDGETTAGDAGGVGDTPAGGIGADETTAEDGMGMDGNETTAEDGMGMNGNETTAEDGMGMDDSNDSANGTTNGSAAYSLSVTVENESGEPVPNATVEISNESGGILSGIFGGSGVEDPGAVSSEGQVSAELSNGNYTVSATADGYQENEANATIEGEDAEVTLTLNQTPATTAAGGMGNGSGMGDGGMGNGTDMGNGTTNGMA